MTGMETLTTRLGTDQSTGLSPHTGVSPLAVSTDQVSTLRITRQQPAIDSMRIQRCQQQQSQQ